MGFCLSDIIELPTLAAFTKTSVDSVFLCNLLRIVHAAAGAFAMILHASVCGDPYTSIAAFVGIFGVFILKLLCGFIAFRIQLFFVCKNNAVIIIASSCISVE